MDVEQEMRFIRSFVRRERRERVQFELLSGKKRGAFLSRLCHGHDDILDARFLKPIPLPNSDYRDILKYLTHKQAPATCYAISTIVELDGAFVPLVDALEKAVGFGLPTIIISIPGKLGFFEAEQEGGPPLRYFLERA